MPTLALPMMDTLFGTFGAVILLNVMFSVINGSVISAKENTPDDFLFLHTELKTSSKCLTAIKPWIVFEVALNKESCTFKMGFNETSRYPNTKSLIDPSPCCNLELNSDEKPKYMILDKFTSGLLIGNQVLLKKKPMFSVSITDGLKIRDCLGSDENIDAVVSISGRKLMLAETTWELKKRDIKGPGLVRFLPVNQSLKVDKKQKLFGWN
jgi:hypothetical protein